MCVEKLMTQFRVRLDELNAYSHDLDVAIALVPLQRHDREVDHRDGLAALMTFVVRYVDSAQKAQPATRQGLHSGAEEGDPNVVEPGRDRARVILRASGVWP
jgi:hypothetical protein